MVELVDTQDSESCAFTGVEVRFFSSAPFFFNDYLVQPVPHEAEEFDFSPRHHFF